MKIENIKFYCDTCGVQIEPKENGEVSLNVSVISGWRNRRPLFAIEELDLCNTCIANGFKIEKTAERRFGEAKIAYRVKED